MVSALVGLVGVLVGSMVTMVLQHYNWLREERLRAYAALFPKGIRELTICESLEYAGMTGNDEMIDLSGDKQPSLVDSPFLESLTKCWLLETDSNIRASIEKIEETYKGCRLTATRSVTEWRLQIAEQEATEADVRKQLHEKRERLLDRSDEGPDPGEVIKQLQELKVTVGRIAFHGWCRWR